MKLETNSFFCENWIFFISLKKDSYAFLEIKTKITVVHNSHGKLRKRCATTNRKSFLTNDHFLE